MSFERWIRYMKRIFLAGIAITLSGIPLIAQSAQELSKPQDLFATPLHWETPARMYRTVLIPENQGTLLIDLNGVQFRAGNERTLQWAYNEIRTVSIGPHRLEMETYHNPSLHLPGERKYRFDFTRPLPPAVAASLAAAIRYPSRNVDPDPSLPAIAEIPVHHRVLASGTNGVLRFRQGGIDYVTSSRGDSRSWRWADLQTLSDPDPYHLLLFGFRDTYTFDLKAPLSRKLLDWAADEIFTHNESTDAPAGMKSISPESGASGARHE